MRTMKAAPAPNTPFLNVSHDGGESASIVRYLVWYAFLAEPASKQISAMRKKTLTQ